VVNEYMLPICCHHTDSKVAFQLLESCRQQLGKASDHPIKRQQASPPGLKTGLQQLDWGLL
jgi:hypothetical protein